MTEGALGPDQGLEPGTHIAIGRAIDQEESGPQRGQILEDLSGALVGGDLVIGDDRGLAVRARELGGLAQAREHAIAGARIARELGEGRFRLLVLAGSASVTACSKAAPASAAFLVSHHS